MAAQKKYIKYFLCAFVSIFWLSELTIFIGIYNEK